MEVEPNTQAPKFCFMDITSTKRILYINTNISAIPNTCEHCGHEFTEYAGFAGQVNHYLEQHGYTLLHVGAESSRDYNTGQPYHSTVAVLQAPANYARLPKRPKARSIIVTVNPEGKSKSAGPQPKKAPRQSAGKTKGGGKEATAGDTAAAALRAAEMLKAIEAKSSGGGSGDAAAP